MSSYFYIKLYHEILHDPKMGRLTDNLWRRVIEIFLLAGENGQNGNLPSVENMAWELRLSIEELEANLQTLAKYEIVSLTPTGWHVTHFERRQAPIEGKVRVSAHRDREKKQAYYATETDETQESNESVTTRYTDIELDIDIDQEKKQKQTTPAKPDGLNDLQKMTLAYFGAKRFKNSTQAAIVSAWDRYPQKNVIAACEWAATKGFGLGQAIASIEAALPKWGAPKSGGNGQTKKPATRSISPDALLKQKQELERQENTPGTAAYRLAHRSESSEAQQ